MNKTLLVAVIGAAMIASVAAHAAFIATIEQVVSNFGLSGTGAINVNGSTPYSANNDEGFLNPNPAAIGIGPPGGTYVDTYSSSFSGPNDSRSGDGDMVGFGFSYGYVGVPVGYISGNPLTDEGAFSGATLARHGIRVGTGTWTWRSGANADSFTLYAGVTPPTNSTKVPEPRSIALLVCGLFGPSLTRLTGMFRLAALPWLMASSVFGQTMVDPSPRAISERRCLDASEASACLDAVSRIDQLVGSVNALRAAAMTAQNLEDAREYSKRAMVIAGDAAKEVAELDQRWPRRDEVLSLPVEHKAP